MGLNDYKVRSKISWHTPLIPPQMISLDPSRFLNVIDEKVGAKCVQSIPTNFLSNLNHPPPLLYPSFPCCLLSFKVYPLKS